MGDIWHPRQESNLHYRIRNPVVYPLTDGGKCILIFMECHHKNHPIKCKGVAKYKCHICGVYICKRHRSVVLIKGIMVGVCKDCIKKLAKEQQQIREIMFKPNLDLQMKQYKNLTLNKSGKYQ